jgi:predicted acetylornithine/succinylornithine family transaminase
MKDWIDRADEVIFRTYSRFPLVLVRGEGCRVWDQNGKSYLDMVAGLAVCNVGHCHPKVVDAIREQTGQLIHVSNLYYTIPQVELAERLVELTFADRVFFCNSGAEANEGALKLARKIAKDRGHPERFEVITMENSFHGRTLATVSATAQEKYHHGFEPLVPGFRYVPFGDLEAASRAINERTCAILVEPIQGEGGVHCPPEDYLRGLRELCDAHDILLILDEVQTGMGRTGTLFAHQGMGAVPHVMTVAKGIAGGLPMGAILASEEVASALTPGTHASTFGGNPVAAAAGLAVLSILIDDGLMEWSRGVADHFRRGLEELAARYRQVREVRGRGWILGMELEEPGAPVVEACMERGLLINCTMERVLRFIPPLSMSLEEAEEALENLERAFAQVWGERRG